MPKNKKLLAENRHEMILAEIAQAGFVTVIEMAGRLNVSEMTLRRDLDLLAENGRLQRSHGGAVGLNVKTGEVDLIEPDVNTRADLHALEKQVIANHAIRYAKGFEFIALDIGTSNLALAKLIKNEPLRVFTSSVKIADQLSGGRVQVYMPGGEVRGFEPSVVGARAIQQINTFHFNTFFLGASSLSFDGVYDYSLEDSEVKRALIERSTRVIALIDSSKFERISVAKVAEFGKIDLLITDANPSDALSDALKQAGVKIEIATY